MTKQKENRWAAPDLTPHARAASEAFVKRSAYGLDLSGIRIGTAESPAWLAPQHFDHFVLREADLSKGEFSCVFNDCDFSKVNLQQSVFDSCRMVKSRFTECDFRRARLRIIADGAVFDTCVFDDATFFSRGDLEYGGRRISFNRCQFNGTKFRRVEFRAARFIDCSFNGAQFERCDLRGAKFEGGEPSPDQIHESMMTTNA